MIRSTVKSNISMMKKEIGGPQSLLTDQVDGWTAFTSTSIFHFLGIKDKISGSSDVAGALANENGQSIVVQDSFLPLSVVKTKLNNAVKDASQDFKREWKEAIGAPISVISERFLILNRAVRCGGESTCS